MDGRNAPAVMDGITDEGDETPTETVAQLAPARSWRASSQGTNSPDVALSDAQGTRAAAHLSHGQADPRRNNTDPAGHTSGPDEHYKAAPELIHNQRQDVAIDHKPSPERPRQGFTGSDPTRAARFTLAYLLRPFDKGIADHPGAVTKAPQDSPTAARPPERRRLIGGRPSATGTEGTGMLPVSGHRNTRRRVPSPYDDGLVDASNGASRASVQRARGWRL